MEDIILNRKTVEYDPANCELNVEWTKKDEQPKNLKFYIDMKGVKPDNVLIALYPNKFASSKS